MLNPAIPLVGDEQITPIADADLRRIIQMTLAPAHTEAPAREAAVRLDDRQTTAMLVDQEQPPLAVK